MGCSSAHRSAALGRLISTRGLVFRYSRRAVDSALPRPVNADPHLAQGGSIAADGLLRLTTPKTNCNRRAVETRPLAAVHLVVVPIDYTENSRVLIDELREKLKKVADPMVCIAPE